MDLVVMGVAFEMVDYLLLRGISMSPVVPTKSVPNTSLKCPCIAHVILGLPEANCQYLCEVQSRKEAYIRPSPLR